MFRINKILFSLSILSLSTIAYTANNEPIPAKHVVVTPQCLINNIDTNIHMLSSQNNLALIETNDAGIEGLIEAKNRQAKPCGGFMDVTHAWNEFNVKNISSTNKSKTFLANYITPVKHSLASSYTVKYPTQVNQLLKQMNPQYIWSRLGALSNYQDRYSRSNNGVKVANEIKAEVEAMAQNNGREDVTAYLVGTGSYIQPSVVVKIGTSIEPGIVIGAHMDTLSGALDKRPGADDDGSGSVTVLEVARTLLSSGMHFNKPIYLIWYAAEEMGLVGSQYVVADFKNKNIPVSEVLHLDMTGYAYQNDLTMWLIDDYVNANLSAFLETLIKTYVKQPVKHTSCGYACSDHATWTQNGYTAAMPFESSFYTDNPNIHSSRDTIDKLSLTHMKNYASLAIAFAVELAEPSNN